MPSTSRVGREASADGLLVVTGARRRDFRADPLVVLGYLLRPRVIRTQRFEHCRRSEAADGKLARAVDEFASVHVAVNVAVEQLQHFLRKVACLESFHGAYPPLFLVERVNSKWIFCAGIVLPCCGVGACSATLSCTGGGATMQRVVH